MTARPTATNMTAIEVTQAISENEQITIEATIVRTEPVSYTMPKLRDLVSDVGLAFGNETERFFDVTLTNEQKAGKFKITPRMEGSMTFSFHVPELIADYFIDISPDLAVILADEAVIHLRFKRVEASTGAGRTEAHELVHAYMDANDPSAVHDAIDIIGRALHRTGIEMITDHKVTKLVTDKKSGFGQAKIHVGIRDTVPRNIILRDIHLIKYLTLPSKGGQAGNGVSLEWPKFLLAKLDLCHKCNRYLDGMTKCGLCAAAGSSSSSAPAHVVKRKATDAYAARVAKRNAAAPAPPRTE